MICPYLNNKCREQNVPYHIKETRCHGKFYLLCGTYIHLKGLERKAQERENRFDKDGFYL